MEQKLIIGNTFFKLHSRGLYTWKPPGDTTRNQIDYVLTKQCSRIYAKFIKTYHGADTDSDYNPVVIEFRIRFKTTKKEKSRNKIEISKIKKSDVQTQIVNRLENNMQDMRVQISLNDADVATDWASNLMNIQKEELIGKTKNGWVNI